MRPPRRWLDDADDAPDGALDLLRTAEPTEAPSAEALRRVAEGVAQRSAAATLTPPAMAGGWKVAVAVVGVAALATVLWPSAPPRAPVPPPPSPSVAPSPARTAPAMAVAPAAPPIGPPPPAPPSRRPPTPAWTPRPRAATPPALVEPAAPPPVGGAGAVVTAAPSSELAREAAWLERSRRLLATDPAAAARELRQYPVAFPRGRLADEASFLTFEALRRDGRVAEARALGESTLAAQPDGLYAERLRRGLAALPEGGPLTPRPGP